MKKALLVPALVVGAAFAYMIRNHADFGAALPPGFPSDIPIVAGEIISGRRTLFEDGRGYVVDIRSELSYRAIVDFYADRFGADRIRSAPGMGENFYVGDIRFGDRRVLLEIYSRDAQTHLTIAVHLGTWW